MDYFYESEIIDNFEYVMEPRDELDFVSEVSSGSEEEQPSDISMVLEEVKNLRMENKRLEKVNLEIKKTLENVLELQMQILNKEPKVDLSGIGESLDSLITDNSYLHDAIHDVQQEVLNVKHMLKSKRRPRSHEKPIGTEINGEWKLIKSNNVDDFLNAQPDIFPFEASRIRNSNVCFEIKKKQLKTCNWMKQIMNLEVHHISIPNEGNVVFSVENNKLISVQRRSGKNGEVFSIIERFIEDGKLHIIWERDGFSCERVYEKLDNWSANTDPFKDSD